LTVFLGGVLTKRYTNPSSDVIDVLAGLDQVDLVFAEFVTCIDLAIRNGSECEYDSRPKIMTYSNSIPVDIRQRAVETAIAMTAGSYQTGLVSYFTHRDLFPSLMKVGCLKTMDLPAFYSCTAVRARH